MRKTQTSIQIDIHNNTAYVPPKNFIKKVASVVAKILFLKSPVSISFAFVSDAAMKKWNQRYRRSNSITDVLSFRFQEREGYQGEIIIAYPYIKKQAKKQGISIDQECIMLFIHGLLHIFGYNHNRFMQAKEMWAMERNILIHFLSL